MQRGNYEWAVIQAYYAAFHALTALLMQHGYDESGHRPLYTAVRDCFVAERLLDPGVVEDFGSLMRWREEAQYAGHYSPKQGEQAVKIARQVVEAVARLLP